MSTDGSEEVDQTGIPVHLYLPVLHIQLLIRLYITPLTVKGGKQKEPITMVIISSVFVRESTPNVDRHVMHTLNPLKSATTNEKRASFNEFFRQSHSKF